MYIPEGTNVLAVLGRASPTLAGAGETRLPPAAMGDTGTTTSNPLHTHSRTDT